jgi:hypothetical protein
VRLAEEWREIERALPDGWSDAQLLLRVAEPEHAEPAAALLTPLMPGRHGAEIRFHTTRRGGAAAPGAVRRQLRRLDHEGIRGSLELVSVGEAEPAVVTDERPRLVDAWDAALAGLPSDWSDIYAEVELTSTDHLDRSALLLAPLNPTRYGERPGFRFRVARRFGYGASPGMTRRCLERTDEEGIDGRLRILHVLSDTDPVATQGPVWYVAGKAV